MEAAGCLTCMRPTSPVTCSMLWTCLHLPDFSLQLALRGATTSDPLVITSNARHAAVLSCNPAALQCGIRPGMSVSAAWALTSHLIESPRDIAAETRALENLAQWAGQFTPDLSLQAPASLLLEVQGCLRLFGGLRGLSAQLQAGLKALGYHGVLAHAPTPLAAWLFAQAGIATRILDRHDLKRALSPLPLSLLHQRGNAMEKLAQMGVRTLGDCLKLPRDGFSRRFGQEILDDLDRALGRLADPRPAFLPPSTYAGHLALPQPIGEVEPMLFGLKRLVAELAGFLLRHGIGVTKLRLDLHHEGHSYDRAHPITQVLLRLAVPTRDPERLLQLLRERLLATTLATRTEGLSLHAEATTPLAFRNLTLFPDDQTQTEERLMLLEHLRARLGTEKVQGVSAFPDHRPEFAYRTSEPGQSFGNACVLRQRPLWLLHQPRALACDETGPLFDGPLVITTGPERIESGWWDGHDIRRDYFTAQNNARQTLWIFRERSSSRAWYIHGLFG